MAKRVTILSQFFYPETAAVPQLLTELAVELRLRGFDVVAYTGHPTYHKREKLARRETYQGVKIRRVFSTQFRKDSLWGRLFNGATFSLSVAVRLLFARNPGVVLVTTTPPFLAWVVWLVSLLRRHKYVLLIQDVYPDIAVKLGFMKESSVLVRVWRFMNRKSYRCASTIIVLGDEMRNVVQRSLGKWPPPIHVIHNWADGTYIRPCEKQYNWFAKRHGLLGKIIVLYSGNLGLAHDFETLVEAADRLRDKEELLFLFIGEGGKKAQLMAMVKERGLTNVRFLPHVPYEHLPYSLAVGDIGVVTLERGAEGLCEPSKVYGYLAAGLAILGLVGEKSEVAKIIERHQCGYRVDQGDVESVVEALEHWLKNRSELETMKARARDCFERFYDKKLAIEKYAHILESV